jgi:hypothetical protein
MAAGVFGAEPCPSSGFLGHSTAQNKRVFWLVWFVILCSLLAVHQAGDCLAFDSFPFDQDGLATSEVDVGGRQIADALVVASVVVVGDEGLDVGFEIARQIIVLEQDAVFQRLMPALSTAAEKCATWRRESVPVGLREKGRKALEFGIAARIEARGA